MIHSTVATLRSPVSISASSSTSWKEERTPARWVRKPNSCLSWRWTGTLITVWTGHGALMCRPGGTSSVYLPKVSTTPTSSGSTEKMAL